MITHIGNGCCYNVDRHKNPILMGLSLNNYYKTFIADGVHLPNHILDILCNMTNSMLISDASPLMGSNINDTSTVGG